MQDDAGQTGLHYAADRGFIHLAEVLLLNGGSTSALDSGEHIVNIGSISALYRLYIGSISALYRHRRRHIAGGEAVILSTGTPIPAQWTCRRRCRYRADIEPGLAVP